MKILLLTIILVLPMLSFGAVSVSAEFAIRQTKDQPKKKRKKRSVKRSYYGRLVQGARGGCYYINRNGKKTYVARSLCR